MKTTGKHLRSMLVLSLVLVLAGCAGSPKTGPAVSGLLSIDEAIEAAAAEIESKIADGSEILVAKIKAPKNEIGDYLCDELTGSFSKQGKLVTLAREEALKFAKEEQEFQESGLVSDASARSMGNFLGAKVVVSGTFDRYEGFSQLRIRAVDVETSKINMYSARIRNDDPLLANISAPFGAIQAPRISEEALVHLNNGKDFFAEGKLREAIQEFDKALAINKDLADAYFYRGYAYLQSENYDFFIADLTQAINCRGLPIDDVMEAIEIIIEIYESEDDFDGAITSINQFIRILSEDYDEKDYVDLYDLRGAMYAEMPDYDRAIADYTRVIRLSPNDEWGYFTRGKIYWENSDLDRAIIDLEEALRISQNNPSNSSYIRDTLERVRRERDTGQVEPKTPKAYVDRGDDFYDIGDYDNAIADYTQAIKLNPVYNVIAYFSRGTAYSAKGDIDSAIDDYTTALGMDPMRIDPNSPDVLNFRGVAYANKGDYDKAIVDLEEALQLDPNYTAARNSLERIRQARGR